MKFCFWVFQRGGLWQVRSQSFPSSEHRNKYEIKNEIKNIFVCFDKIIFIVVIFSFLWGDRSVTSLTLYYSSYQNKEKPDVMINNKKK